MSQRSPPLRRRSATPVRDRPNDQDRPRRAVMPGRGLPPLPAGMGGPGRDMDDVERTAERKARTAAESTSARLPGGVARVPESPPIPGLDTGQPLDPATLAHMQGRFGADLSAVRLHSDAAAAHMAASHDAEAFAVGSHVVFGRPFDPTSQADRQLLTHELAHVVEPQDPKAAPMRRQPKRQTSIQGLKPVYFQKMRQLLLTQPGIDSDTVALVRSLDLTSTRPQKIKSVTAGGKQLEFNVSMKWQRTVGGRTVRLPSAPNTAGADFDIALGHTFPATQIVAQHPYWKIKDAVDQRAWLMAEVLHHELLHLQIEIDKVIAASDPTASFSESFKQYVVTRSYLQEVQQPRYKYLGGDRVGAILRAIPDLISKMCFDIPASRRPSAASQIALTKQALGFFVQEKYAFWKTAATFGPTPDNPSIAHSYVRHLFAGALDPDPEIGGRVYDNLETTRRRPTGFFGELAQELEQQVKLLFEYLDTELMGAGMGRLK